MVVITFPTGSRIYLDANIFIYAAEAPAAFPALISLLRRLDQGDIQAVTSSLLSLAEVLVAPLRNFNTALESAYQNRIASGASLTVVGISREILIRAAEIRASTPTIKLPDAIHAATCLAAGCDAFFANDGRIKAALGLTIALVADLLI